MNCNICNSEMTQLPGDFHCNATGVPISIYTCKCGLIAKEIQPNDYFERAYSGEIDNPYYKDVDAIIKRNKERVSYVKRFVNPYNFWQGINARILDYGAGVGHFVKEAMESGYSVCGIEKSEIAIKVAKDRFGIRLSSASGMASYDAITMWDVIEHVESPRSTTQNLLLSLAKGGYLFVETANAGFWDKKSHWAYLNIDHNYYFTQSALVGLMESEGLKFVGIINTRKYLRYLFPIVKKSNKVLTIYVFKK